mmetsp:Transcript_119248/g.210679  ORF Transcript_119248/g.210679 Transcript_119248/m.210679 type:complete len:195 (-) Transcript_119248:165-749(-)
MIHGLSFDKSSQTSKDMQSAKGLQLRDMEDFVEPDDAIPNIDEIFGRPLDELCQGNSSENVNLQTEGSTRFKSHTEPPKAPQNPWFLFAVTTIFLCQASASDVANSILDWLASSEGSSVNKVNPDKFSIKGEVCLTGLQCGVKLRMYQHGQGYALEFQMRNGDAIAFNTFYQKALEHLKSCEFTFATGQMPEHS